MKKYFVPSGDEVNSFTSTEWERAFVKAMDKNILKKLFCDTVDRRRTKEKRVPIGEPFRKRIDFDNLTPVVSKLLYVTSDPVGPN